MANAYQLIRSQPALVLSASGTEVRGGVTHTTEVDSWSDLDAGAPRARLKITSFYDGKLQYGWAADGVQLFHYDPALNEYSSSIYGSFSGKQPDRMVDSVLQSTFALSKGAAVWPIRLLRDIYSGDIPRFKTWMPDAVPSEIITKTVHTVTYQTSRKQLIFALDPTTGALVSIDFWEQQPSGPTPISSHWRLTLTTLDAVPKSWDFSFKAPEGCRPVPLVRN